MIGAFIPAGQDIDRQREQITALASGRLTKWFVEAGGAFRHPDERDELNDCLNYCRTQNATFCLASLRGFTERRWQALGLLADLLESEVDFEVADDPRINKSTIEVMFANALETRERILMRSGKALARIKERIAEKGEYTSRAGRNISKLGASISQADLSKAGNDARSKQADEFAQNVWILVEPLVARGVSQSQIASHLNAVGLKTSTGRRWHQSTVRNLIERCRHGL